MRACYRLAGAAPAAASRRSGHAGAAVCAAFGAAIAACLWASLTEALAASEFVPVVRHQEAGMDLLILETSGGYLIDVRPKDIPEPLTARFFLGDEDVTTSTETTSALAEIVYLFSGGDAALQCRSKLRLDAVLGQGARPDIAVADQGNTLCPEAGFIGTSESWPALLEENTGYRRLLVIEVSDGKASAGLKQPHPFEWERLSLTYDRMDEAAGLIEDLVDFVEPGVAGFLSFVPVEPDRAAGSVKVVFYLGETEWLSLGSGRSPLRWVEQIADKALAATGLERRDAVIAAAVTGGSLGMLLLAFWRRRKRRPAAASVNEPPVRAVRIGYGQGYDFSLGAQGDHAVARVELYRDGRRRLVRLAGEELIEVDGVNITGSAWVDSGASVRIANRKIVLS